MVHCLRFKSRCCSHMRRQVSAEFQILHARALPSLSTLLGCLQPMQSAASSCIYMSDFNRVKILNRWPAVELVRKLLLLKFRIESITHHTCHRAAAGGSPATDERHDIAPNEVMWRRCAANVRAFEQCRQRFGGVSNSAGLVKVSTFPSPWRCVPQGTASKQIFEPIRPSGLPNCLAELAGRAWQRPPSPPTYRVSTLWLCGLPAAGHFFRFEENAAYIFNDNLVHLFN